MFELELTKNQCRLAKIFSFLYVLCVLSVWTIFMLISTTFQSLSFWKTYLTIKPRIAFFLLSPFMTYVFFFVVIFLNVGLFRYVLKRKQNNQVFLYAYLMILQTFFYFLLFCFLFFDLINPFLGIE